MFRFCLLNAYWFFTAISRFLTAFNCRIPSLDLLRFCLYTKRILGRRKKGADYTVLETDLTPLLQNAFEPK
jgi:hypothetical protein